MSIISTPLPFIFTNGTTADANQVNSNLNQIVSNVNANAAANGANADITSLTALQSIRIGLSSTQPAFESYRNSSAQNSGSVVVFDTVRQQNGAGYASGTGVFTAPATGWYIFNSSVSVSNTTGGTVLFQIQILVGGSALVSAASQSVATGSSATVACGGPMYVTAAQTIAVSCNSLSANLTVANGSNFGGILLY
jgi:hypothetical protein